MLHALLGLMTGLLGHLIGDPVHKVSAMAIKAVINAGSLLDKNGAVSEMSDLLNKVDSIINSGRATTEQEWRELMEIANRHIEAIKSNPAPAVPPVPPAETSSTPVQSAVAP